MTQLSCIVAVGVNNSFLRILLHKCAFLASTIVTDNQENYLWRFWRFLGDFGRFLGDFLSKNSFLRILLHECNFLASNIVADTLKNYIWQFFRFFGRFLGDF